MFAMFNRFFAMFETLFSAGERSARALDSLAEVAETKAMIYRDEERAKHANRLVELSAESKALLKNVK